MTSGTAPEPSASTPAILYVDDEVQSLKYFRLAFERDFPVICTDRAAKAEAVLNTEGEHIGVLVTDQRMPEQTGVQLLGRVKDRHPNIVRLLTTAYTDMDAAVDAVNRGEIHRYIFKPWNIEQLRAELNAAILLHQRKKHEQLILEARRGAMVGLAAQIAHELRTPLASVKAAMHGLREFLPELTEVYRQHGNSDGLTGIPVSYLNSLEKVPDDVCHVVDRANSLINMVLMNTQENLGEREQFAAFSVRDCVQEALRLYPFSPGEKDQAQLQGKDFQVWGSEVLFSHVIHNLLKNALHACRTAGKGDIKIQLQPDGDGGRLLFRDSGSGIAESALPHIFDTFYTDKRPGTGSGMGLAFCRRVVTAFGGSIECRSRQGEFTEFEIRLVSGPTDRQQ